MKKQSSGLYRTKVVIGHDPDGKSIHKWISGKTKKELEAKKQAVIDQYINGNRTYEHTMFGQYVLEWYRVKKAPFLSDGTQALYRSALNARLIPAFRNRPLKSITNTDIQAYMNSLSDLSLSRVNTLRNILYGIFESAVQDGLITLNPVTQARVTGTPQKDRRILNADERKKLEEVASTHEDGLLLAMLYYTGMRDGEMMALRWGDIDMNERTIHIHCALHQHGHMHIGKTKTAASVRTIPIPQPLYDLLAAEPPSVPASFVIHLRGSGDHIRPCDLRIRWSRLMCAAGFGYPEAITRNIHWRAEFPPHTLRHNYTTMLYENGIDPYTAAKLLGHSNIQTTMNIYTHFSQAALSAARTNLDAIFKNKKLQESCTNENNI